MAALHGDLTEWFADQYRAANGVHDIHAGVRFEKLSSQLPVHCAFGIQASGRNRMEKFLALKMRYPLLSHGYNCLALGARLLPNSSSSLAKTELSSIYAFVFSPVSATGDAQPAEYICVAPTFESRDGEFRRRFIPLPAFHKGCKIYTDFLAAAEDLVARLIASGSLVLFNMAFGSATMTVDDRLPVTALAVAVTLDAWDSTRGVLAAHINRAYLSFITSIIDFDTTIVLNSRKLFYSGSSFFRNGTATSLAVACGVKLVPMFAREVQQPFDFNLGAWRELEITRAVSDLVVQFVSPSFALYNQWSYVERAGPGMFENAAMHERYARSRRLAGAVEGLRAGRHALDALDAPNARDPGAADPGVADPAAANPAAANPAAANPATHNLPLQNYHTEELSSHIYEALDYAQSFLLTSDVAMMHTMEDVGRTLQSWPAYIRGVGDPTPAAIALFANAGNAARVLFEYAYGVHCLHTLVGVAHGDLHSNNLTVFEWGRIEAVDRKAPPRADGRRTFTSMYEDPVVIYATGTRADTTIEDIYMFPADGISGALIDYSRAIVGPAFRSRLEAGRTAQYATNFYRDQVNRAMRTLHRYAPEYVAAHQDELKGIAYADFDSLFAVLCAVDFIAIGASVAAVLEAPATTAAGDQREFRTAPETAVLARALEVAGRKALISGLHMLVASVRGKRGGGDCAGGSAAPSIAEIAIDNDATDGASGDASGGAAAPRVAFPGKEIITHVFRGHTFAAAAPRHPAAQPVDAYNYSNFDPRVSATDYEAWPRWARLDEIEKHLGDLKMRDLFERGTEDFLSSLPAHEVPLEVIAAQARVDAERRDGKPTVAASSWIDE